MGTSLEDIKDIREFIYTYILPEPEVNVEFLQKDMRELERLQEILQEAKEREVLLEDINEKINEAKIRLSKVKINEILVAYANYQGNIEEQQKKKQFISEWNASIGLLNDKLEELNRKEVKANALLKEAERAAEDNTENKEMLSLERENKYNEEERKNLVSQSARYHELVQQLSMLKKRLKSVGFICEWEEFDAIQDYSLEEKVVEIKKVSKILADMDELIKDKDAVIRNEIRNLNNQCQSLENKIKSLELGVMCYPEEAILVRDKINEQLSEQSKKTDAKLLCELLYMLDDSWQDAVESYLNTQRFNIIVSPENYLIAKKIFISLGDRVKGIGLIDTRKIGDIEYIDDKVSYLADKIESENIYAKRYARYVMRDVACCDNADDLEQYPKSVTKDRLRFQNYCLQRMRKKEHYIGVDAIEKQLDKANKDLKVAQKDLSELKATQNLFDVAYKEYNSFTAGNKLLEMEKYCDSERQAKEIGIRITEIKDKIAEFKKNPILLAMYDRVSECENNRKAIVDEITRIKARKQNFEEEVNKAQIRISSLEEKVTLLQKEYEDVLREYPEYASDVENKYLEERKTKKASVIADNFGKRVAYNNTDLNNYMYQQLIPLQQKYTATYTCDFPEGIEGAARYQQAYLTLKNIDLERHKEELNQAQVRCKDRFRKEVLFRMKDDILRAKQQFKQINRVMENLEYGEESYRFGIGKSKDKELGIFYEIIMDKDNQQIDQDNEILAYLAEANKSEVFESQIDDFMSRIMMDVEEHAKENLTGKKSGAKSMGMYVDYRTYLDYDIIVKNSVTKIEVPLSKVSGEGSGGENQAPFYVAICASLLQIYEQNPDGCMRLILLDEAFNNMTSDRIEPMMNMFKKLNLQLVLIATAEKATAILPYCDITYSIVKSGNRNAIGVFERL